MEIARIRVDQNKLDLTQYSNVTRGLTGGTVTFESFGPDWAGLSKTAVFRTKTESRDVVNVLEGQPVAIPWEVLDTVGCELMVGIYGCSEDGRLIIPTIFGGLGTILPGAYPTGRPAQPHTPDWTAQIETQVNHILTEFQSAAPMAQQAAQSATDAAESERLADQARIAALRAAQHSQQMSELAADSSVDASQSAEDAKNQAALVTVLARQSTSAADEAGKQAQRALAAAEQSVSQGVTGAKPGDVFVAAQVDDQGRVTAWKPSPLPLPGKWAVAFDGPVGDSGLFNIASLPDGTPLRANAIKLMITGGDGNGTNPYLYTDDYTEITHFYLGSVAQETYTAEIEFTSRWYGKKYRYSDSGSSIITQYVMCDGVFGDLSSFQPITRVACWHKLAPISHVRLEVLQLA